MSDEILTEDPGDEGDDSLNIPDGHDDDVSEHDLEDADDLEDEDDDDDE